MTEKTEVQQDDISLIDIYAFFRDGWKLLTAFSVLGLLVGMITAFTWPEKFQARALIEPASVAKRERNDTITKASVEPAAILAEKMKVPTYYETTTIQACDLQSLVNPGEQLVNQLNPTVGRNSSYVSVTYKAETPARAEACIKQVLQDIVNNQANLAKPLINNLEVELANAEQELQSNIAERDQQRLNNRDKLKVAKSKLAAAENFVDKFSKESLSFKFDDQQFSATALLLTTLIDKQNEVKDLEIQINALELVVAANMTDKDQAVRKMANTVSELKNSLSPPNTKPATFAAPIYTSDTKVEPKRAVVTLIGLLTGGFAGLLCLVCMRLRNNVLKKINRPHQSSL